MPSIYEDVRSRGGTLGEHERVYVATGYATEALAIAAAHSYAPSSIDDLDLVPDQTFAEEFHQENWRIRVRWRLFEPSSGLNYSFTIGGTSIFREYSIANVSSTANTGDTAPDMNNAINFDGKRINGVQLPPQSGFEFTLERRKPIADVDIAYVTAVSDLLLTVNDATFQGFPAGEVLFLGVTGSRIGTDEWILFYKFARADNLTGLSVDTITGIAKEGWEYLWVYYEPFDDTTAKVLTVKPKAVYVEQVFEDGDFTGLEL